MYVEVQGIKNMQEKFEEEKKLGDLTWFFQVVKSRQYAIGIKTE